MRKSTAWLAILTPFILCGLIVRNACNDISRQSAEDDARARAEQEELARLRNESQLRHSEICKIYRGKVVAVGSPEYNACMSRFGH